MRFTDCGEQRQIHYETSNPTDFRIDDDGVIFAARTFDISPDQREFIVYGHDEETRQFWHAAVNITLRPQHAQDQVGYSMASTFHTGNHVVNMGQRGLLL